MKGDSVEGGDHDAVKPPPFAALLLPPSSSSGPSAEEMRDVMARTLAEHETGRIKELVARSAAAERDAQHLQTAHEEFRARHDELERRSREEREMGVELRSRCAERAMAINGHVKKILELEVDKSQLEERFGAEREAFERERGRMEDELADAMERHDGERRAKAAEAASEREARREAEERYDASRAEFETTRAKLVELIRANDELDA